MPAKHEPGSTSANDRPRRDLDPLERALEIETDLAHEPVLAVRREQAIVRLDELGAARRPEHPESDLVLVRAQVQDQIVELASERQRPERAAGLVDAGGAGRRRRARPAHRDLGKTARAVDLADDVAIADPVAVDRALERSQRDTAGSGRPIGARRELGGATLHDLVELRARRDLVHEAAIRRRARP